MARERLPAQCPCCAILYSNFRSGWAYQQAYEHVAATSQYRPSQSRVLNEMWRLKQDEWAQHLASCRVGQDPNCPPGQRTCYQGEGVPSTDVLEPAFYPGGFYWDEYNVKRCRGPAGRFAPQGACAIQETPEVAYPDEEFADDDW